MLARSPKQEPLCIESGVQLSPFAGRNTRWRPTLAKMKVGDSFKVKTEVDRVRLVSAIHGYRKHYNAMEKKFTVRPVEFGWRCWRLK